jgi:uncharacterized membrane protein YkoI
MRKTYDIKKVLGLTVTAAVIAAAYFMWASELDALTARRQANQQTAALTRTEAGEMALARIGGGRLLQCDWAQDGQGARYQLVAVAGNMRYDMELDALSRAWIRYDATTVIQADYDGAAAVIGPDEALRIASAVNAGTVSRCVLQDEDGRMVYAVEFYSDALARTVRLDAVTGELLTQP